MVVIPSLWECWPYAALEPLHLNRPVLATPVGGLVELVSPGSSGWLASGTDAIALEDALERLLDRRGELEQLVRSEAPVARGRALSDEREILDAYQALARTKPRRRAPRRRVKRPLPLVSAIVPYYRASRYVRDTIEFAAGADLSSARDRARQRRLVRRRGLDRRRARGTPTGDRRHADERGTGRGTKPRRAPDPGTLRLPARRRQRRRAGVRRAMRGDPRAAARSRVRDVVVVATSRPTGTPRGGRDLGYRAARQPRGAELRAERRRRRRGGAAAGGSSTPAFATARS